MTNRYAVRVKDPMFGTTMWQYLNGGYATIEDAECVRDIMLQHYKEAEIYMLGVVLN